MKAKQIVVVCSLLVFFPMIFLGCGKQQPGVSLSDNPVEEVAAKGDISSSPPVLADKNAWPGWRGPTGDGLAEPQAILTSWSETENIAWTAEVPGRGHSSPTIFGNLVVLATADEGSKKQMVVAWDRQTGKEVWRTVVCEGSFPGSREVHRNSTNANGTVACDGTKFFCNFLNNGKIIVAAISLTGEKVWEREAGAFESRHGYAPSPLLYRSVVIVVGDTRSGSFIVAFDRENGEIAWRKKRPSAHSYATPLLSTIGGKEHLVVSGANKLTSYNPATGEENWSVDAITESTVGTAVTDGKLIVASGGYPGSETIAVSADGNGAVVWKNSTKIYQSSPLIVGDKVIAVTDEGVLYCWKLSDGKQLWKERLDGSFAASPVLCKDLVLLPSLEGETILFRVTNEGYEEVARNKTGEEIFASPAVVGGEVFLRYASGSGSERKEKLICIRGKESTSKATTPAG